MQAEKVAAEIARQWLANNWSQRNVALKFQQIIRNEVPEEWIGTPDLIHYNMGWGLSKINWLALNQKYIERFGSEGLFLADPNRQARYLRQFHEVEREQNSQGTSD